MRGWLTILVVLAAAAACGGGGGANSARCEVACRVPTEGPCRSQSTSTCESDCNAATEGLAAVCAQCIAEQTGWTGRVCGCYGTPCCLCGFSPGDNDCSPCAQTDSCAEAQETCTGYEIGSSTSAACAVACGGPRDGG